MANLHTFRVRRIWNTTTRPLINSLVNVYVSCLIDYYSIVMCYLPAFS